MKENSKKTKALLLFSGGLDSILAAKILEAQGIEVTALTFVSYFFDAEQAKKSAQKNKIDLVIRDISAKHLGIVKNPRFGRGAGMNPCVDCHLLMLKEAKKIVREGKFDFLATGEVLGQRPMSQNIRALELIERKANLEGRILRPLSALALSETEMERTGMVDREKLMGISGRSRKEQMELAEKYEVKDYPTPAGGCILTDQEYSKKLRELVDKVRVIKKSDVDLLRLGRHFWVGRARVVLGRNHEENIALKKLAEGGDVLIEPKDIPGPTALIRGRRTREVLNFANSLLAQYTKNAPEDLQLKISTGSK
ncbi:MAG TPA: tRNA 4-thiouridine(8) synthase ThiI [Candidatus Bathyarchaeia archaeon]|nr:tRNA 4-thiouridine(8) synthase ThiI [Candidatus Bathyarchaeia archaeon]